MPKFKWGLIGSWLIGYETINDYVMNAVWLSSHMTTLWTQCLSSVWMSLWIEGSSAILWTCNFSTHQDSLLHHNVICCNWECMLFFKENWKGNISLRIKKKKKSYYRVIKRSESFILKSKFKLSIYIVSIVYF